MSVQIYGFTERAYNFGSVIGSLPTRALFATDYTIGDSEQIVVRATFGQTSSGNYVYTTLLDTSTDSSGTETIATDLRNQTIDITSMLPAAAADVAIIVKVELHVDTNTPDAYSPTENLTLYFYTNASTGDRVASFSPPSSLTLSVGGTTGGSVGGSKLSNLITQVTGPQPGDPAFQGSFNANLYPPISGVQVNVLFKDTNTVVAHTTSNSKGTATLSLPPGSYDAKFSGPGFTQSDWLVGSKSFSVGSSSSVTVWGSTAEEIERQSEYNYILSLVNQVQWAANMIPESFLPDRVQYRDESADSNDTFTFLALEQFGRIYKGGSSLLHFALAIDR